MKVQVLISCMFQKDHTIIKSTNVQTDVVVINQCDKNLIEEFDFYNIKNVRCHAKFINTTDRGLSKSRNLAISNSWGEILYMCDDDELLVDDYEDIILSAYEKYSSYDLIAFSLVRKGHSYPVKPGKIGIVQILKISSVQTTFKRTKIINKIFFDEKMGSGTGNGGGEENKFLMDCRREGLNMYYVPKVFATVKSENSMWFDGFSEKYFKDTFWAARRILGPVMGFFYIFYWCLFRSNNYDIKLSKLSMIKYSLVGFFEKR